MSSKCIDFLYVIKSTIVNDCFVICVGLSLLSKTVDMTQSSNKVDGLIQGTQGRGLGLTSHGIRQVRNLGVTSSIEFFPNWSLLPIGSLYKYFLKIKTFPHLCWDLNLQPLAYEARTIPQNHQDSRA